MKWEKSFTKWVGSRTSVIVHTLLFIIMFSTYFVGVHFDSILLVLTTLVSLEAIYLSIFIQMTVNENTESLEEVEEDIEDIAEEVTEISEDIDEIQQDVDEIQHDVDEIQEDVDEIEKEADTIDDEGLSDRRKLEEIEVVLKKLLEEVQNIKKS